MNVEAGHVSAYLRRPEALVEVGAVGFGEKITDGVEQERSRTAGGIQDALLQGRRHGIAYDLRRQPIGRVVLTEPVPLFAVDQRFVENLENVALHFGKAEAAHVVHDPPHQVFAGAVGDDPVEEVAFYRAVHAGGTERLSRQQLPGIVLAHAHDGQCDALRDNHQKRVLEPQAVAFHVAAVHVPQQVRPQLALQRRVGVKPELLPQDSQPGLHQVIGNGVLAKFRADGERIRRQRRLERERPFQPGEKCLALVGIEHGPLDDSERARVQFEDGPQPAVGGDPDEMLCFFAFAVREVVGHSTLDILPLAVKVALGFEDGATDECIQASAHFGHPPLEIERFESGAELFDQ